MRQHLIRRTAPAIIAAAALALAGGCSSSSSEVNDSRKVVVCTTTMISDLAQQVAGPHLKVVGIMKWGMDPHIYDPTPEDAIWLRKADLVLVNGLHLEGRMIDMIESAGAKVVALGEHPEVKLRQSGAKAAPDPHVWWNVKYFVLFAEQARDAFKKIDPQHAAQYDSQAAEYSRKLLDLDAHVRQAIAGIPEHARYMITSHDAFFYYGEAYGLHVDAVLGISTDAQAGANEPGRLARIASERKLPSIFHETSVSAAQNELIDTIQRIAREKYNHELHIAGPLYSDSLGGRESGAETYIGAVEANTQMILEGLTRAPATTSAPGE